jgi:hypothetical protein
MQTNMILRALVLAGGLAVGGCATVEGGFRYEYDGRIVKADGKTPVKGVAVRLARPGAPEAPDMPLKFAKNAVKYVDKSQKTKSDKEGKYIGALETVKGWKYTQFMGMHSSGPTKPPEPPVLTDVIVYVQEKGGAWMGYAMKVPADAQTEAISGIRKIHMPDLLLPDKPATQPATQPTTQAVGG